MTAIRRSTMRLSVVNGRQGEIGMKRMSKSKAKSDAGGHVGGPWRLAAALVVGMVLMWMGACSDVTTEPPDRSSDDEEVEVDIDIEGLAQFEEIDEYSRPDYPVRRNPFRPDSDVLAVDEQDDLDDEVRATEPLEQYSLSALSLVTIISETTVPKAMFVDPTGLGHFAKEGDRIGRNDGVIRGIRSNEVEVQEGGFDSGATVTVALRERELRMADDDEDGLTEAEREMLRRLLESDEGREALEDGIGGEQDGVADERFPGLQPPERN